MLKRNILLAAIVSLGMLTACGQGEPKDVIDEIITNETDIDDSYDEDDGEVSFLGKLLNKIKGNDREMDFFIEEIGSDGKKVTLAENATLREINFHEYEMYYDPINNYRIVRDGDECKVIVCLDLYIDDQNEVYEDEYDISEEEFATIEKVVMENTLDSWDGYQKSNPNVLDGGGFSFSAKFTDGSEIHASGSNACPENYGLVSHAINELIVPFQEKSLIAHGFMEEELPLEHLDMVAIDSWSKDGDSEARLRRVYLTEESAQSFPELNQAIIDIDNEILEKSKDGGSYVLLVERADTNVTSLLLYHVKPGAKGVEDVELTGYNFETRHADVMDIWMCDNDLLTSISHTLLNNACQKYGERIDRDRLEEYLNSLSREDYNFVITNEQLVIYINPGIVADASLGVIQIPLEYKYGAFWSNKVKEHPDNYAEGVVSMMDMMADMDGDGYSDWMSFVVDDLVPQSDLYKVYKDGVLYLYEYTAEKSYENAEFKPEFWKYSFEDAELTELEHSDKTQETLDSDDYCNYIFDKSVITRIMLDIE